MAIVSQITVIRTVYQPDGYVPADLVEIEDAEDSEFTTDVAIANADAANEATGLDNILAAVKAFFDADFAVNVLKLDAAAAINANIHVTSIKRTNTSASIYLTGTEVFRVKAVVKYA